MKKKQARQISQFQQQQVIQSSDLASGINFSSSTLQQSQMQVGNISSTTSNAKQVPSNINASSLSNGVGQNAVNNQSALGSASLMGNINCNQLRAGDWVCLLCNNLNFSFRNECNRCMIQTKKQNLLQNLMLVQEGQSMIMSEINKSNPLASQSQSNKGIHFPQTSEMDENIQVGENGVGGENFGQTLDKKEEDNLLEYSKYGSKGGSGFENMLLLLTPNRSSIHSDDYYDHRVNNTTAPQSNNSNSKSDPDQSNNHNKKKKAKTNGSITNPALLSSGAKSNEKMQFDEDIFISSNEKDNSCKPSGVMLQFSSPEDAKYINQQQQIIGNIFTHNSNTFAGFGGQKSSGVCEMRQNYDNQLQQEERREFQLFGSTKPNVDCPHFISSPSSMRDGDESLNESDSGNFQQEIQQQINNIMMDEEDENNNLSKEEENGQKRRDTVSKPVEIIPFFNSEQEENSVALQQHQILAQSTQLADEKPSFSFGGNFQQSLRNGNNLFNRPAQVDINSSDKLITLQSNQSKQVLQSGGLLFGGNNNNINSNTGFFNLQSNSNALLNNNTNQKSNGNNNIFFGEHSINNNNVNSTANNNSIGINFSNYNTFLNSNHFGQQSQSNQVKSTTPPLSVFGDVANDNNNHDLFSQYSNKNRLNFLGQNNSNNNLKSGESQFSLFSHQNTNQPNKSTLFSIDENSNTLPTNNIFNKITQYENYYKKEELINQNTINFEQASSFISKGKNFGSSQKQTGRGTVLFSGNEDFADMSDLDDEDGDSSSESRIMKSAKKSNNIRKKRKQPAGNNTDTKKKNKIQQQHFQQHQQQIEINQQQSNNNNDNNNNNNDSHSFNNPNIFYNYNQSYQYQNSMHEDSDENKQYSMKESSQSQAMFKQQQQDILNNSQHQNSLQIGANNSNNPHIANNLASGSQGASNASQGQQVNVKKQDWICPRCTNLNYSFRKLCNKCQFAKNNFAIHIPPNFSAIQQQLTIF